MIYVVFKLSAVVVCAACRKFCKELQVYVPSHTTLPFLLPPLFSPIPTLAHALQGRTYTME